MFDGNLCAKQIITDKLLKPQFYFCQRYLAGFAHSPTSQNPNKGQFKRLLFPGNSVNDFLHDPDRMQPTENPQYLGPEFPVVRGAPRVVASAERDKEVALMLLDVLLCLLVASEVAAANPVMAVQPTVAFAEAPTV
jgi:hypothetical protein